MPNGKTHDYVGIASGLGLAAYDAKEQKGLDFILELLGGAVGGRWGAKLPDILEPGTSSQHRSTAHSLSVGGFLIAHKDELAQLVNLCRQKADECRAKLQNNLIAMQPTKDGTFVPMFPNGLENLALLATESFWRVLAGLLNGLVAGYISHLTLDCFVGQRSVPLLIRGF